MRSNLLTFVGVLLILACVILLGYWRFAIGLTGLAFLYAGYADWRDEAADDGA